jgi:hypothetical protein
MAFNRNHVRRNYHAQPSLEFASDGVGGKRKNWEPKNDEPERVVECSQSPLGSRRRLVFPRNFLPKPTAGKSCGVARRSLSALSASARWEHPS